MASKPRGRELGLPFPGQTGPFNAITDVPGVLVGYTTLDGRSTDGRPYTVAALVQANHGVRHTFTVLGVPVGKHLPLGSEQQAQELGSIIVVLATDAPLLPHQLQRLARRAAIGFGRNGSFGGNASGDLFLALSTANAKPLPQMSPSHLNMDHRNDGACDALYLGAVESTEEAVINAMLAADDAPEVAPGAGVCRAIDHVQLLRIMARYGRLGPTTATAQ